MMVLTLFTQRHWWLNDKIIEAKMARNLGVLDSYFAGPVAYSKLAKKAMSFGVRGENPNVGTSLIEDVWEEGGRYPYPLAANLLSIVSTSASDTSAGGGLEFVTISGCDAKFNLISELVKLNGITPVNTVNEYYRVFTMKGAAVGVIDLNTKANGKITAYNGADLQSVITIGNTSSKQAFITVLDGYTGFFSTVYTSGGPNDDFIMRFASRPPNGIFTSASDIEISNSSIASITFNPFVGAIPQHYDMKVEAAGVTANAQVRINYIFTMIQTDYLQSLADSI